MGGHGVGRARAKTICRLWLIMLSYPVLTSSFCHPLASRHVILKAQSSAFLLFPEQPSCLSSPPTCVHTSRNIPMRSVSRLSSLARLGTSLFSPSLSSSFLPSPASPLLKYPKRQRPACAAYAMSTSTRKLSNKVQLGRDLTKYASKLNLRLEPLDKDFFSSVVLALRAQNLQGMADVPTDRAVRSLFCNSLIRSLSSKSAKTNNVAEVVGSGSPSWPEDSVLTSVADVLSVRLVCHKQTMAEGSSADFTVSFYGSDAQSQHVGEIHLALTTNGFVGQLIQKEQEKGKQEYENLAKKRSQEESLFVFFDLESTGLDTSTEHITQIAAESYLVPWSDLEAGADGKEGLAHARLLGKFSKLVQPGVSISTEASAITGLTNEMLADTPRFDEQGRLFLQWLEEQVKTCKESLDGNKSLRPILIAHNGMKFDFLLLGNELRRHGLSTSALEEFILWDTLLYFRERGHKVCRLGVLFEEKFKKPLDNAHDATVDVLALAELTLRTARNDVEPAVKDASLMPVAVSEVAPVLDHIEKRGICAISSTFFHDPIAQLVDDLQRQSLKSGNSNQARPLSVLSASPRVINADGGVKVNVVVENLQFDSKDEILAMISAGAKQSARPGEGGFQGTRLTVLAVRKISLQHGEDEKPPSFSCVTIAMPPASLLEGASTSVEVFIGDLRPLEEFVSVKLDYERVWQKKFFSPPSQGFNRRAESSLASSPAAAPPADSFKGKDLYDALGDIPSDWKAFLGDETDKEYFKELNNFYVDEIAKGNSVYPPTRDIFGAFKLCPLDQVSVIIVGQDPYHGAGQAHGLAFSVRQGVALPPSLQNVFKELESDPAVTFKRPRHGSLEGWARQGVLLLNTCLTVRAGQALSHQGKGWEKFTDAVISKLDKQCDGLVFLLWGQPAAKKCSSVDEQKHLVLKAPHPSPLSARRGFFGCQHFSLCNQYLAAQSKKEIKWQT